MARREAVLCQRPRLDRAIVEVVVFDVRRRLDLDELRLGLAAVEHVDAHADAVVIERRLEDRLAAAGRDERARRVDRRAQAALEAHEMAGAAAVELPRELADGVTRREQRGLLGRRLFDELRAVGLEPQLAPALRQRQQLGLREGDRRAHGGAACPPRRWHNRRNPSAAKIARMQKLGFAARAAAVAVFFACAAAAWGQDADDVIRTRVEELRATGVLAVQGEPLASHICCRASTRTASSSRHGGRCGKSTRCSR